MTTDPTTAPAVDDEQVHCYHVDRISDDDDWEPDDDECVHCDCCCTCLGCEYGPRDGMLMFPEGVELP